MQNCRGYFRTFLLFIVIVSQGSEARTVPPWVQSRPAAQKNDLASNLLRRSYLMGSDLVPAQRAFLLFRLATAAEQPAPNLSKKWAEDLFRLTFELDPDWNRSALQKNALVVLSNNDPVAAFHFLRRMSPLPEAAVLPEDLRADAANTVFLRYWNQKVSQGRLQEIRAQAQEIGSSGQYPFRAVSTMLHYLLDRDESAGIAWFSEICLAYEQGSTNIRSANPEFVAFIQEFWPKIPAPSRREALLVLIPRLTQPSTPANSATYLSKLKTPAGAITFTSVNERLLFQVFPLLRELDPSWAEQLLEDQSATFRETLSEGRPLDETQVYIVGNQGFDQVRNGEAFLQRQEQLGGVFDALKQQPSKALQLASQITDTDNHLNALEGITGNINEEELKSSGAAIEEQAKGILEAATEPLDKVRAFALLAEASAQRQDATAFQQDMDRAFDLGELVFEEFVQSHPVADVEGARVMNSLMKLVSVGMRFRRVETIARIEQCQDHILAAYLLAAAARESTLDIHH